MDQLPIIKGPDDFVRAFNVSRETSEKLQIYVELLRKWQKAVNLVALSTIEEVWHRHIGDSAQLVDIVNKTDSLNTRLCWLDIGSGGGFPGLVAAIMLANTSDVYFHLVESNGRKCAFLAEVVRQLKLPVKIHNCRVEELYNDASLNEVNIISARALAPLDHLFTLIAPFMDKEQTAYLFKGRDVNAEMLQVEKNWVFNHRKIASRTSVEGCLLQVSDLHKM